MNWKKLFVMLLGFLFLICGIYSLVTPITTFLIAGYVVGVIILCDSIADIVAWFESRKYADISMWHLISAIISAIFGIILIANVPMQFAVDIAIIYFVCIWIIVLAIARISLALKLKRVNNALPNVLKNSRWIGLIIMAILMIVFAVICMMKPVIMSGILGIVISVIVILNGVSLITIGSYIENPKEK